TIAPHIEDGEQATLDLGSIQTHVPKLGDKGMFSIDTPNAKVIVHGTTFEVDVQDGDPRTHVHVTEGRVEVVSGSEDVFLSTGESWPTPKTATVAPPIETHAPVVPPKPKASVLPSGGLSPPVLPRVAPPTSALAEQNKLLQAALAARREGRDADALAKLDELLRVHPNSPLAQEAHANRF